MIEPFHSALPILEKLEEAGYEAYFVGGSVRDYLLKKPIHDVDIATSATPVEVKRIFTKTVDVGIEHGTILVLSKGTAYEVTTFRSESQYLDYRRPSEVAFITSLRKDLERRDFTMNAIAMDKNGLLIDPFDGQNAIKLGVIETVGNANERFHEDALRIMRAVRFVGQLSFSIEQNTLSAIKKSAPLLEKIAVERKRVEFEKLLGGTSRSKAIALLLETKLHYYLPGMRQEGEVLEQLLKYNCEVLSTDEMWVLILMFSKLQGKEREVFLREWKLPVKQIKKIIILIRFLSTRIEQEWSAYTVYLAGMTTIHSVEKMLQVLGITSDNERAKAAKALYVSLPIHNRSELAVSGSDLMDWLQQSGGPWLSETLARIEQKVLFRELNNNKQEIKEWLLTCNHNEEKNC